MSTSNWRNILLQYARYSKPYSGWLTLYLLLAAAAVFSAEIAVPLSLKALIDALVNYSSSAMTELDRSQTYAEAFGSLIWLSSFLILTVLCRCGCDYSITHASPLVARDIEVGAFEKLIRRSLDFFSSTQIGALVSKVKRYADAYDQVNVCLTHGVYELFLQLIMVLVFLGYYVPLLSLLVAVWGIFFVILNNRLANWKMRYDLIKSAAESRSMGTMADAYANFLAVKIFSNARHERDLLYDASSQTSAAMQSSWYVTTKINVIQGMLTALFQIGVLCLSLTFWRQGRISVGTIVLVQTYLFRLCASLSALGNHTKALFRALAAAEEMSRLLEQEPEIKDPKQPEAPHKSIGEVRFNNVCFGYSPERKLFDNFSLTLRPGERLAVVGASGSGKSTLIKLLLRLVDAQSGTISINQQDIKKLTQDDLRRYFTYVPQEPSLFHRSIFDNIAYGSEHVSTDQVIEAARNSFILDLINKYPRGMNTLVGERGMKLSGGEKQRIAIARAFLRNSPIVIFDEATNSLDSVSEEYIQRSMEKLMRGRTTIVIAHRLSTVQMMERIVVLDHGTIVESGTHTELLAKNAAYAALWAAHNKK